MSVLAGGKSCLSKELIKLLNLETLPFWLNLKLFSEVIEILVVRDIWRSLVQPLTWSRFITSYRLGQPWLYLARSLKPPRMEALQMFWGSLSLCWTLFVMEIFFLMSSLSLPGPNWCSFACVVSSATTRRSWTGDRPVGYLCTTAVKKISGFSACETEQKVIVFSPAYSRPHLVSWNIMFSVSAPSHCTLPPGVKGRTCWRYHAEELSKKRSDWLNIHLCKYFPCQFRQKLLTIHSIMLSTH